MAMVAEHYEYTKNHLIKMVHFISVKNKQTNKNKTNQHRTDQNKHTEFSSCQSTISILY